MRQLAVIMVLTAALAACNTVRGVGQDIEDGGEAIQRGASEVQQTIQGQ